jgi:hypothetical protein
MLFIEDFGGTGDKSIIYPGTPLPYILVLLAWISPPPTL